jgi:hypothetical protein
MTNTAKPTRRETFSYVRGRALVVTLHGTYLTIREKGLRYAYTVTYDQVRTVGAKNAAEQLRQAKAEARKAKTKRT